MPGNKGSLVLLDFDGTLMSEDIFAAFLKFRLRTWRIWPRLVLASPFFVFFKLKLMDNEQAKERVFQILFAGEAISTFQTEVQAFWEKRGTHINPLIAAKIQAYREEGAEFWIVSANFQPIIEGFCKRQGGYQYLCTELAYQDQSLSGRFASPNCYGPEKVRRIEEQFKDRNAYEKIHAYGDSAGDFAMLNWADEGYLLKGQDWHKID